MKTVLDAKPIRCLVCVLFALGMVSCSKSYQRSHAERLDQPIEKYARCNIKVLPGNIVSIQNFQSTPMTIPVGTKAMLLGPKLFRAGESDADYLHDLGIDTVSSGKFFVDTPPNLSAFDNDTLENIRQGVARLAFTKEAAYIAMGPTPIAIDPMLGKEVVTGLWTYEQIKRSDVWIYHRGKSKFEKRIGVAFDPTAGKVNRTEGIWR